MRRGRVRQQGGDAAEDRRQSKNAKPENGPVPGQAPVADRRAATGPSGDSGDSATATTAARIDPRYDRRLKTDEAVEDGVGRIRAQCPEDPQVVAVDAQPARHELGRDEDGGQQGDRSEDPQARWRSA